MCAISHFELKITFTFKCVFFMYNTCAGGCRSVFCLPQGMAAQKAKLGEFDCSHRAGGGDVHASQTPGHLGVTESQGVGFRLGMVSSLRPRDGAAPAYSESTVHSLAAAVAVSTERHRRLQTSMLPVVTMKKTDHGSKLFT